MKDCRGVEIKPGATVVHVSRSGSWMTMSVGTVTDVGPHKITVDYERGATGRPYVSDNIMVVEGVPYVHPDEA